MQAFRSPPGSRAAVFAAAVGGVLSLTACGDDPAAPNPTPTSGSIEIRATTTGTDLDPNGYTVRLNGTQRGSLDANGSLVIDPVSPGTYEVSLLGVAPNCAVGATLSTTVEVVADRRATADFAFACLANVGAVRLSAITDGLLLDPDGYHISFDGGTPVSLGPNAETVVALDPGTHTVALSGQAPNCTPHREPRTSVAAAFGDTVDVAFEVTCFRDPIVYNAFVAANDGTEIFVVDAAGGPSVLLTTASGLDISLLSTAGAISPARTHVVFSSTSNSAALGEYDIYVMALNKSELYRHSDPGPEGAATWSPDGTRVAFSGYDFGGDGSRIHVATTDLASVEVLEPDTSAWESAPLWSPDGTRLAFYREDGLHVMNADGSGRVNVSNADASRPADTEDLLESWSPDGSTVLFRRESRVTFASDLWSAASDGVGITRLTDSSARESTSAFSPDGRIFYTLCTADCASSDVWAMNGDGTGKTAITTSGVARFAAFNATSTFDGGAAPGTSILTAALPDGTAGELARMNPDGTNRVVLATGVIDAAHWR